MSNDGTLRARYAWVQLVPFRTVQHPDDATVWDRVLLQPFGSSRTQQWWRNVEMGCDGVIYANAAAPAVLAASS